MNGDSAHHAYHVGPKGRVFKRRPALPCYDSPPQTRVPRDLLDAVSSDPDMQLVASFQVPRSDGRAFRVLKGQLCRFVVNEGSQVGDVNVWNLHNHKERFYSGKTRQLHASHLTAYDRLWSCMPFERPMATITVDTIAYGWDEDGAGVHDVIGTRCDPYIHERLTGKSHGTTCHENITRAIKPFGLTERDVHDVFNIFMCTGFDPKSHTYFAKGSPAEVGDAIEMLAEFDLLVALSSCPQGDVSIPCGQPVPDSVTFPLLVEIRQPSQATLQQYFAWSDPTTSLPSLPCADEQDAAPLVERDGLGAVLGAKGSEAPKRSDSGTLLLGQ
ncbi:unnamed protein product [Vitrella brassicaformis CCMP3155]|uniref:DUF1989 domain-containing protein n=2 Tax=Vitrella brassicaformis TaxID=1169539 RepID=A0A0G4H3W1_VITBC|nr:unnamed protein product [Vitrella brassicaformis CCMP3155]|mmetsp:Transcript_2101/g.4754  ORF Transcript_2101/g.4754 Transcript_2101/m.4754 type:complete len:328 (+) Transcript_2101:24-1007(+)|eukprot:CEM38362.1 unnamed protein product [Vitrella brassicaformis CCMP3155]